MGKKILYIILAVLVVGALFFLVWMWLFGSGNNTGNNGNFGNAGNATSTFGGAGNNTNGQTPIGGSNGGDVTGAGNGQNTNGQIPLGGGNTGGSGGGDIGIGIGTGSSTFPIFETVPGVSWIGSPFNPSGINNVTAGINGNTPTITQTTSGGPGTGSGPDLGTVLAGTAIAGSLSCAIQAGIAGLSTGGTTGVTAAVATPPGILVNGYGALIVADAGVRAGVALQAAREAGKDQVTFLGCIVNTVAKVALQTITVSVVNWINSGFDGKPSFVNNYQKFFTNVADLAAGQFIQGAGLSFLCSPFQLQVRIAIAQSYASRSAQSCSLTGVIRNVTSFMNGNFSQGGWNGLVSFTTVPTNNPYGAYAYGQIGLVTAQQNALSAANRNISPSGFLNVQQQTCRNSPTTISSLSNTQAAKASCPLGCDCSIKTPGSIIESSLSKTLGSGIDQLGLANNLDQIISALTTQLMIRVLQNGLTSISEPVGQTTVDSGAQSEAVALLNDMRSKMNNAQQLGSVLQGTIADIQSVQADVNNLYNCWASSSKDGASQKTTEASAALETLNDKVSAGNASIVHLNESIVELNQYINDISSAASARDVNEIKSQYNARVAAGAFVTSSGLTTAQQNRTTLQAELSITRQSAQSGLAQCNA